MRAVTKIGWDVLVVWMLLVASYAYFYQDPAWNGNSRFALAVSMVRYGSLTIDAFHASPESGLATGDVAFYNGHYYTDKAVGSSVLAAAAYLPLYWLTRLAGLSLPIEGLKQVLTFLALGLPSSLCGVLIYKFCKRVSGSTRRAFLVTCAVALGTMVFPYSVTFFGHQLAGSFLFAAFYLMFELKNSPDRQAAWMLVAIGLGLGMALITEFTTLLVAVPLGVYYLLILWQRNVWRQARYLIQPLLGGLIPLAILLAYNSLCFGSPFKIGYNNLSDATFQASMAAGLMGIGRPSLRVIFFETFHPAEGLFWQSPVLLMILPGWYAGFKARQYWSEGLLALFACAAYLVMNAGYFMWWGGDAIGPRAIIPMLPFLCIPLIRVPRRVFAWMVPLTVISVGQMLLAAASTTLVPTEKIMPNLKFASLFGYSTLYNYCWWKLSNGVFAPNLGEQILGLQTWASLLPLLVIWVGGTIVFCLNTRHQ
jgi:hypothetical protein